MAILPISSVNVKNNSNRINFGMHRTDDGEGNSIPQRNTYGKSGAMVTVPVAVLMALATTSLNAAKSNSNVDEISAAGLNNTEMVQQKPKLVQLDKKPYKLVRDIPVKEVLTSEYKGEKYYLIFAGGEPNDNVVDVIYFTNANYTGYLGDLDDVLPGIVKKMVYHNPKNGQKPTMGIVFSQQFRGAHNRLEDWEAEVLIPPESANPLIDLMVGDSKKWQYIPYGKGVEFEETTNPKPQTPRELL